MSYLVLKLKKKLKYRINLSSLIPNKIVNKKISNIKSLNIFYGKEKKEISDFFSVSGNLKKGILLKGDLNKFIIDATDPSGPGGEKMTQTEKKKIFESIKL